MLLRYPALVEGVPPNRKRPRPCVVVREVDLDVLDLDLDEAPVAAVVLTGQDMFATRVAVETEIRTFDGSFYVRQPFGRAAVQRMLADPFSDTAFKRRLMTGRFDGVAREDRETIWPPGLMSSEMHLTNVAKARTSCVRGSSKVILTTRGASMATSADAAAVARCSISMIGGQPWLRVQEPVYVVRLGARPVLGIVSEDPWMYASLPGMQCSFYALTERDRASAEFRRHGGDIDEEGSDATVLMPEAFSDGFDGLNLARFARSVAPMLRNRLPADDSAQAAVATVLATTEGAFAEVDHDALDDCMNRIAERLSKLVSDGIATELKPSEAKKIIAYMAGWNDRPVEIAAASQPSPTP